MRLYLYLLIFFLFLYLYKCKIEGFSNPITIIKRKCNEKIKQVKKKMIPIVLTYL